MNSKPISLITAAGGLAVLAAGCCCNKIVTERETPQITLQPENVETSTNRESYALLTLDIAREPKEGYQFAWFKETLAKDCTSEGDSVALRTELQTKRPGCFTDTLVITNATPAARGNYYCDITHQVDDQTYTHTRSRSVWVQVYESTNVFRPEKRFKSNNYGTTAMATTPQVVTSPHVITGQSSTNTVCHFNFNASFPFKVDDNGNYYLKPTANSRCFIWVTNVGTGAALKPGDFYIIATSVPAGGGGQYFCTQAANDPNFPNSVYFDSPTVSASTKFKFTLFLANNPNNSQYKVTVQFN